MGDLLNSPGSGYAKPHTGQYTKHRPPSLRKEPQFPPPNLRLQPLQKASVLWHPYQRPPSHCSKILPPSARRISMSSTSPSPPILSPLYIDDASYAGAGLAVSGSVSADGTPNSKTPSSASGSAQSQGSSPSSCPSDANSEDGSQSSPDEGAKGKSPDRPAYRGISPLFFVQPPASSCVTAAAAMKCSGGSSSMNHYKPLFSYV